MRLLAGRRLFGPMEGRNRLRGVVGWAVGKKDHGCSQTAVLPQTAQFGVNRLGLCAHGVAFTGLEITTAVDADQVMAQGSNDAETIRPFLSIGGASQNSIGYRNAIVLDQQFHYQPTPHGQCCR